MATPTTSECFPRPPNRKERELGATRTPCRTVKVLAAAYTAPPQLKTLKNTIHLHRDFTLTAHRDTSVTATPGSKALAVARLITEADVDAEVPTTRAPLRNAFNSEQNPCKMRYGTSKHGQKRAGPGGGRVEVRSLVPIP